MEGYNCICRGWAICGSRSRSRTQGALTSGGNWVPFPVSRCAPPFSFTSARSETSPFPVSSFAFSNRADSDLGPKNTAPGTWSQKEESYIHMIGEFTILLSYLEAIEYRLLQFQVVLPNHSHAILMRFRIRKMERMNVIHVLL
jgi:hypothetical protein